MHRELIYLPQDISPILTVVIHTEEEFEWGKGFDKKSVGTRHIKHIHTAQDIFDEYSIKPTYVVDYPIASQQEAIETLKEYSNTGRAEIGAHLHPWVSPPYAEEVNAYNSYPGNLPRELEFAKLATLTRRIKESFGTTPKSYLAGRYGFGPNTGAILQELGYEVDISAAPPIDFSDDGGPDYSTYTSHPFWIGEQRRLLALPGTGAYVGTLKKAGHSLYQLAIHPWLRWAHLPGILSRLRIFERLRLSPEGYQQQELFRLTRMLLAEGIRHFVFSFHSPSVLPRCTPYVRNESDLKRFLGCCDDYFDFFLNNLAGNTMSALEFKHYLDKLTPDSKRSG
jgi:hypothetical protein